MGTLLFASVLGSAFLFSSLAEAQSATSLGQVRRLYIGSLGNGGGGEELRRELVRYLKKAREFEVVDLVATADAVLEVKANSGFALIIR